MIHVTATVTHSFTRETLTTLIEEALDTGYVGYWVVEGGELENGNYLIVERDESGDEDAKDTRHEITPAMLEAGIKAMAVEAPGHFADLVGEDWDVGTADVFIQMCIFGELVYG